MLVPGHSQYPLLQFLYVLATFRSRKCGLQSTARKHVSRRRAWPRGLALPWQHAGWRVPAEFPQLRSWRKSSVGFVIMSAGSTFVSTFLVTNFSNLDASCVHRCCTLTCFTLPKPLRLSKHIAADASRCSCYTILRSFAKLWIPSPSDAALTAAYNSLSAVHNDTTCCFLVHTSKKCPPLWVTPAGTDRRVVLSPILSASEYTSNSLLLPAEQACCSWLPSEVPPNPLYSFHVKHKWTCHRAAELHWCELEIWSVLWQVTHSCDKCSVLRDVATCECLAVIGVVTCHLRSVPVVTVTRTFPLVHGHNPSLFATVLHLAFATPCVALILPFHGAWSRRVIRSLQLKTLQSLPVPPQSWGHHDLTRWHDSICFRSSHGLRLLRSLASWSRIFSKSFWWGIPPPIVLHRS